MRFTLKVIAIFVAAFVGLSWAARGFPVWVVKVEPLRPDARVPTFGQSIEKGRRVDWENSKTSQSDGNAERDALRLATLQAANAYALSPCDQTMKANLVRALTAYATAWAEMAGCKNGTCFGGDARLDAAAAAFRTPADERVREALGEAFQQGGVTRDDFPASVRSWVLMFPKSRGFVKEACGAPVKRRVG
jgi:hypothetical protein